MRMLLFEVTYLNTVLNTLTSKRKGKVLADLHPELFASPDTMEETQAFQESALPKTMRAALVTEFNAPLSFPTNIPIPSCPPSRLLVRITACSLCMSDISASQGKVPGALPFCAGHEPVGRIVGLGAGVTGFALDDRVGFMPASDTCNACSHCTAGEHRFCSSVRNVGFDGLYGGFSEYCIADPLSTAKIPEGISDEEAAPLLCAGVTAYGALLKVQQPGGTVINIIGCGGVGHLAIMYAKAMGFRVHAYDIAPDKLALATRCGADQAVNSRSVSHSSSIHQAKSTLVISGAKAAYDLAFQLTQKRGRIIAVGVPKEAVPVDILRMVLAEHSLVASQQGTRADLQACLELAAEHSIKPVYEVRDMSTLSTGFQEMIDGKVAGRLVYKWDVDALLKTVKEEKKQNS